MPDVKSPKKSRIGLAIKVTTSTVDVIFDYQTAVQWYIDEHRTWAVLLFIIVGFSNVWTAWRIRPRSCPKSMRAALEEFAGIFFTILGLGILYYCALELYNGDIDKDDSKFERVHYMEVMYESLPSAFLKMYVLVKIPRNYIGVLSTFWSVFSVAKGSITHIRDKNNAKDREKNALGNNQDDDKSALYFSNPLGLMLGMATSFSDTSLRIITISLVCSVTEFLPVNLILAVFISIGLSIAFTGISEHQSQRCVRYHYGCSKEGVEKCYVLGLILRVLTSTAAGFFRFKPKSKWFWGELVVRHLIVDWVLFVMWMFWFQGPANHLFGEYWNNGVYGFQAVFWVSCGVLWVYLRKFEGGSSKPSAIDVTKKLQVGAASPKSPPATTGKKATW